MAERTQRERRYLGRVSLACSTITGIVSVVYLIRFIFLDNDQNGFLAAVAFAVTMLYGALLGVGLNYTIRVPRGKDDDKSQVIAGMIMALLGTMICVSMQMILGIGVYWVLPIIYYAQTAVILVVSLLSMKFYKK